MRKFWVQALIVSVILFLLSLILVAMCLKNGRSPILAIIAVIISLFNVIRGIYFLKK